MNTKNNTRFQESEQKIKECILSLLNCKKQNKITVQDICQHSGINRSTFYAHYQDIPDLLDKLESDMHQKIISRYDNIKMVSESMLTGDFYIPFLNSIMENKNFYRACLQSRNSFPIAIGYEALMEYVVRPACKNAGITNESEILYYMVFYQAGFTFVLKRWVDNDCAESPEEIASFLRNCIPHNINNK